MLLRQFFFCAGLVLTVSLPVLAQDGDPNVARLSYLRGSVAVQRGDSQSTVAASINAPVLAGDALSTGSDGLAEVQFDGVSMLRVDGNAQVRFVQLEPGNNVVQLAQGTVSLDLLHGADGTQEIDTPSISVQGDTTGRYRVTVNARGETLITVRFGHADALFPQGPVVVTSGQTLIVHGPASSPAYSYIDEVAYDGFDRFNEDRDASWDSRLSDSDYAYDAIDGDDLGSYGQWVSVPDYGQVWSPYVSAGWAPYRFGQWAWEPVYGWVWVSSDPWGWAPYHYGRWFYAPHRGWCWYPPAPNPMWAPAMVAFFSFGNPGFGLGNIGWVPLAPGELYRPWWGRGYSGFGPQIVTNINLNKYYRNGRYGGFTAVDAQHWKQGNFSRPVAVSVAQVRSAHAFNGALPIAPTSSNLRFSSQNVPQALAAKHFNSGGRSFAGDTESVTRTPFAVQRTNVVRSFSHTTTVNGTMPAVHTNAPAVEHTNTQPSTSVNAWQRFDQNRGTTTNAPQNTGGYGNYHAPAGGGYNAPSAGGYHGSTSGKGSSGGSGSGSGNGGSGHGGDSHGNHSPH